jgi:lysophospholipase L1-like esterase
MKFCSDFKVHCVDFYTPFQAAVKEQGAMALYIDGLHPTPEGNQLMANTFKMP